MTSYGLDKSVKQISFAVLSIFLLIFMAPFLFGKVSLAGFLSELSGFSFLKIGFFAIFVWGVLHLRLEITRVRVSLCAGPLVLKSALLDHIKNIYFSQKSRNGLFELKIVFESHHHMKAFASKGIFLFAEHENFLRELEELSGKEIIREEE